MKTLFTIMVVFLGLTAYSIDTVYTPIGSVVEPINQYDEYTTLLTFDEIFHNPLICESKYNNTIVYVATDLIVDSFLLVTDIKTSIEEPIKKDIRQATYIWNINGQLVTELKPGFYIALIGNRTYKFVIIK